MFRGDNIKEVVDGTGVFGDVSGGTICGTDILCSVCEDWWFDVASGFVKSGKNDLELGSTSIQQFDGRRPLRTSFDWGCLLGGGVYCED